MFVFGCLTFFLRCKRQIPVTFILEFLDAPDTSGKLSERKISEKVAKHYSFWKLFKKVGEKQIKIEQNK